MSVIYATLERLETESPRPAGNENKAGSLSLTGDAQGLPVKPWVTALLVVMLGASLMFWHRLEGAGMTASPMLPMVTSERVSSGKPQPEPSPVTEPPSSNLTSTGESTIEPEAVSSVTATTELAVVAAEKEMVAKYESPAPAVTEEPVGAVQAGSEAASLPLAAPAVAPAAPVEEKQAPSSDMSSSPGVEDAIEEARLYLARGQFPQALSALAQLEPVPENRADFWFIKGSAHLGIGQLDLAGMAFESAQLLAPDNAQIAVQRAILFQEKGDHASALQVLKGVAIRHPDVPEIYLNQGYSEYALGAMREAERSFRTFLRMTESRSLYRQQRQVVTDWLAQVSATHS